MQKYTDRMEKKEKEKERKTEGEKKIFIENVQTSTKVTSFFVFYVSNF